MAKMVQKLCACCGAAHEVRQADLDRGWGKFCSKSCKAKVQEKNNGQYRAYLDGRGVSNLHPKRHRANIRNRVYDENGEEEFFPEYLEDVHPFSPEGHGQWND